MKLQLKEDLGFPKALLLLISLSTAFSVANIYYSQPLLEIIREEFSVSAFLANCVTMAAQIGYATGLCLIIPLGDKFNRRKIIFTNFSIITLALVIIAFSHNIHSIIFASFIVGLGSCTPQLFIPLVSQYSKPENKNQNMGYILSSLLVGILGSRVISGVIGEHYGWRTMYYIAAIVMIVFTILVYRLFPDVPSNFKGKYKELMKSIFILIREEPKLMFAGVKAGLAFGAFLSLWAMLAFKMAEAPFYAGGTIVGFLGLCGIAGALAASVIGKYVKRIGLFRINYIGTLLMLLGWIILYFFQDRYLGIISGIIILDVGIQCIQLGNQSSIFVLRPNAVNRLNTVFMTCFFIGGASGTFLAGLAWTNMQWTGVVIVGLSLVTLSLLVNTYQYIFKRNL